MATGTSGCAPDGIVKAKDGFIAIGADDDACVRLWQCIGGKAIGLADKYPTNVDRVVQAAQDEIYDSIEEWAANLTVEEIDTLGRQHDFGVCPVKNAADACSQAQYDERGEIQEIHDPWYGRMKIQGPVPLYSETPGFHRLRWQTLGLGYRERAAPFLWTNLGADQRTRKDSRHRRGGWCRESSGLVVIGSGADRPHENV